jgi:hypothetical protein
MLLLLSMLAQWKNDLPTHIDLIVCILNFLTKQIQPQHPLFKTVFICSIRNICREEFVPDSSIRSIRFH